MKALVGSVFLSAILGLVFAGTLGAMGTREEGAKSIAGVLDGDGSGEYTFGAQAGQVLFVDLDGTFYNTRGSHDRHDETGDNLASTEEGGC